MKKMFVVAALLAAAACGGKSKSAPAKPETAEAPAATTPATQEQNQTADNAAASQAASDAEAAQAQAALTEQYELGKKVYVDKKCASCHGDHGEGNKKNPPVIGDNAFPEAPPKGAKLRKGVTFKTAADVEAFVKAKMPPKAPGTLTDDEAFAVTSWMLSESKVNIEKKLDASNAASVQLHAAAQ